MPDTDDFNPNDLVSARRDAGKPDPTDAELEAAHARHRKASPLTDDEVRDLRERAAIAGDDALVLLCRRALDAGYSRRASARGECKARFADPDLDVATHPLIVVVTMHHYGVGRTLDIALKNCRAQAGAGTALRIYGYVASKLPNGAPPTNLAALPDGDVEIIATATELRAGQVQVRIRRKLTRHNPPPNLCRTLVWWEDYGAPVADLWEAGQLIASLVPR